GGEAQPLCQTARQRGVVAARRQNRSASPVSSGQSGPAHPLAQATLVSVPWVRPSVLIFRPALLFSYGIPRWKRRIHFSFHAGLLVSPAGRYQSRGAGVEGQLRPRGRRECRRMFDTTSATITPRRWIMAALAFSLLAV